MRAELERRLRKAISGWKVPALHASLFGSAARGDGDESSDVDLFVVRKAGVDVEDPRWRSQLDRLARDVVRWTGNHLGLSEVPASDVHRLRRERPPVVEELRRDAITLAGPAPTELVGTAT
jgi:predicted nucleotidyltransferase